MTYKVVDLNDLEPDRFPGGGPSWQPLRDLLGVRSFGVNAWSAAEAGQTVIVDHDEASRANPRGHEELYYVASGHATFTVAGEEIDARAGTFVFVGDPADRRTAIARVPATTVLALGGKRGEPFTIAPWESNARAAVLLGRGESARAKALLVEARERHPEHAGILYNLACAEALTGDRDAALGHIEEAVRRDERFRELAQSDSDFESIRDDPRFPS